MAITDFNLTFADAEATGNTGTRIVGDVINLEDVRDIGSGQSLYLVLSVETAIAAGTDGTIQFALTTGTDASLSSPVNLLTSAVYDAEAGVEAGTYIFNVALPMEGPAYKQYLGVREIVAEANTSAGAINAYLTLDPVAYRSYPKAND